MSEHVRDTIKIISIREKNAAQWTSNGVRREIIPNLQLPVVLEVIRADGKELRYTFTGASTVTPDGFYFKVNNTELAVIEGMLTHAPQ